MIVNSMKVFFGEHYTQKMVSSVLFWLTTAKIVEFEPRWFVSILSNFIHIKIVASCFPQV